MFLAKNGAVSSFLTASTSGNTIWFYIFLFLFVGKAGSPTNE